MSITNILQQVQQASRKLQLLSSDDINKMLLDLADEAEKQSDFILKENKKDLDRMDTKDPKYDRLMLTKDRIVGIASDIRNVAGLESPLGKVISKTVRPNGLKILKVSVPIGVIGIIYEARPNVTFDVFSLCVKSGNATVLKGGSDAHHSNVAILSVIHQILEKHGIDKNIVQLLPPEREVIKDVLNAVDYIDLVIPRGSQNLINFVRENSKVPVVETGAGIVHTYFCEFGDKEKGQAIINNAKTRRVSVCNALDCLIINEKRLPDLAYLVKPLADSHVEIFADEKSFSFLKGNYPDNLLKPATDESFGTEFLDYKMSVKTVATIDEAIEHIFKHSSKHSEAIISEKQECIDKFFKSVDAAAVYSNTSTAYTDGAQFGLGAEIGISTQKMHARGPMGLEELTSYKWIIIGDGQIRNK